MDIGTKKNRKGQNSVNEYPVVEQSFSVPAGDIENLMQVNLLYEAPNRAERIVSALVEYISTSKLEPGHKLPSEKELCQYLDVGNCSLREALIILKTIGLLKVRHGSGWYVGEFNPGLSLKFLAPLLKEFSGADWLQTIEARFASECAIARKAAENISQLGLDQLEQALQGMKNNYDINEIKQIIAFRESDQEFHSILAQQCGNNILALQGSLLSGLFNTIRHKLPLGDQKDFLHHRIVLKHHQVIFDAVSSRDAAAAEQAMKLHLQDAQQYLKTVFTECDKQKLNPADVPVTTDQIGVL